MAGHTGADVLTYGFAVGADIGASEVRSSGTAGMRFRLHLLDGRYDVVTPVLGRHGVHNALAAAAVASAIGVAPDDIVAGLAHPLTMPHRSQLVRAGAWTILDDSYNASPDAMVAALELLSDLPGRHIAVLGEMLELGDERLAQHQRVGRAAAARVDRLIVVGEGATAIADGAISEGLDPASVDVVGDREAALLCLLAELEDGDSVLIKASRGAELDLLVDRLAQAAGVGDGNA
jgi:UDP-N-acetylmuramoyl-tripeptide--D-alanyl-D-alanine ligase